MKREIIKYLKEHGDSPAREIYENSDIYSDFKDFVKFLARMEAFGDLAFDDNGNVKLLPRKPKKWVTVQGEFHGNKNGFGFVTVDDSEEDLFVSRNDVNHAIDGDIVEVGIKKPANKLKGTSAEGRVLKVLEHSITTSVGKLRFDEEKPKYAGYILSRNPKVSQRIYINKFPMQLDGTEVVKVEITKYPQRHHDYFVADIVEIIGHTNDVGIDVLEVLESMAIDSDFPEKVMAEAEAISEELTSDDYKNRLDLRDEITFTIDGADSKDLDDAVHIKLLDNGHFELGVHIADVSYYISEGSELDKEALKRGTSVYVTDRVVPMIPKRLSNGICSLNPNQDRLTQSCIMEIDRKGHVLRHKITQSVIRTNFRMTYHDVNAMIAGDEETIEQYQPILESVRYMTTLHSILEEMRVRRGALNFDTTEAKILVDSQGLPIDIVVRERGIAERMIESFMLAANETVAEHFAKMEVPFIYRVHEDPKPDKLQKFIDYASVFGVSLQGTANSVTQEALQEFMAKVEGKPGAEVLSMMLLRSMQQAKYYQENLGHYGLAAAYYTHFTSPIRRYPDLLVHRLIREYQTVSDEKMAHFAQEIPEIALQSSTMERRAIDAERTVEAMKKAEYMEKYIGQEFDGVVSSVVKFGLFIELPNTIEGLIHITTLPEFYYFNERTLTLQGEDSGKVFRVGQPIKLKVVKADKETGDIDFEYLSSDFDVIEKVSKEVKDSQKERQSRQKNRKPFYKDQAKKSQKGGQKHGKRTGKDTSSK